jgi:methylenetetrahydrofolate dehydrogenase (NADP+)/methenyltetrahydrofolate cyclohydrolase/formyltetrahydrofolate synthetase
MLRRLKKLGIEKTNPDELSPEEKGAFVRLDLDPESITWRRVMDVNDRWVEAVPAATALLEEQGGLYMK